MMFDGRTAFVTAGANGIGASIAKRFRSQGANVALIDIDLEAVDEISAVNGPGEVLVLEGNVSDAEVCEETAAKTLEKFGNVDIFVGNAGGSGSKYARTIEELADDIWYYIVDVNLTSVVRYCRAFVPGMRERNWGRIITISSGARHGLTYPLAPTLYVPLAYATVKEAMAGMVRQFAKDLGPWGITANAVSPGVILTGGRSKVTETLKTDPGIIERIIADIPVGRPGRGEDIASMVAYFASDEAEFVSGEIIEVRGG